MAEVTDKQLIAAIKKNWDKDNDDVHIPTVAEELGVSAGSIAVRVWKLEPVAVPSCQFKANKGAIVRARRDNHMRWERIAARTGKTVSEVKEIGGTDAANEYTGRGTKGGNGNGSKPGGRRGRGAKASGPKAASGRRQAAGKGSDKPKPGARRARTRAEAKAKAGNPK